MMNRFEVAECALRRRGRAAVRAMPLILLPALVGVLLAGCRPKPAQVTDRPQPEAAVKQVTCTGKVVHPDGRAIADATVTAYSWGFPKYSTISPEPQVLAEVTTQPDGSFSFSAPAAEQRVSVLAHKKGMALGWADLRFWEGSPEATIELAAARTLTGKVMDEAGKPVAGAQVVLSLRPVGRGGNWLVGHEVIGHLVRRTGADGRFSFDCVPPRYSGEFAVRAEGKAVLDTSWRRGRRRRPQGEEVELTLEAGANIEAVAVDKATGKPVGGIPLVAINYRAIEPQLGVCISKKDGRYRWEGLPAGSYELAVPISARSTAEWAADPVSLDVKAGETAKGARIELVRGGIVELAIVDAEDGKPVKYPYVGLLQMGKRWYQNADAGKDGVARIRLVPGDYEIRFASAWRYSSGRLREKVTVADGKTTQVELKLKKAPRLHGVVRDPAGNPVAGTVLWVAGDYNRVEADSAGKFEIWRGSRGFRGRGQRGSSLLLARHPDRNLAAAVEVRDLSKPLNVKLLPGLTLEAQVLGPDGRPIPKAEITVLPNDSDPDPYLTLAEGSTGPDGRCRISAIPPRRDRPVLVRAKGYGAGDLLLRAATAGTARPVRHTFRLQPVKRDAPAPVAREIPIPKIPGGWAVWGATGRDSRGHIWFGVTAHEIDCPSAHLFEYVPKTGKLIDRGNVVDELKRAGVYRKGEGQMKIHSKIIQAADGHLYFASMDEEGENEDTGKLPKWGGHLWRLKLKDNSWEHLLTTPEALIAVAGSGKFVYTMGYWDHALYQYDITTGKTRSVKVGALVAHVSRNILCDRNGHVYVPRIKAGPGGVPTATLVEYDTSLKEIGETPLRHYFHGRLRHAHGIVGLQTLPDGAIAFMTHNGYLSMIRPSATGPAKVTDVGWFHPDGPKYAASLFLDDTGRFLMGAVGSGWRRPYQWVCYDLKTGSQSLAQIKVSRPKGLSLGRASLYGSATRDDAGGCYVVGVINEGEGYRDTTSRPIVLQIRPAKPKPE